MKSQNLSIARIEVLDFVERTGSRVEDATLLASIREGEIQQPLVVVEDGRRILLVDGLRRLRIARTLGIGKAPVVFDEVPASREVESYIREIRFVLDEHRQDLLPTQKAELIEKLKDMFGLTYVQIALYLGIDQDSVTNWSAVAGYIEPVREAIDAGRLTMQAARVFVGMNHDGQRAVWKDHERDLTAPGAGKLHRTIRAKYPPEKFPHFYKKPEVTASRLKSTKGARKATPRPKIAADDKRRLLNSYEVKETELRDGEKELKQLRREIAAATSIVAAITRNEKLWAMVPEEMREELERFVEIYC